MRGDGSFIWIVLLAIALVISVAVARSAIQTARREREERSKAEQKIRDREAELSDLKRQHAEIVSAKEREYNSLKVHMTSLVTIVQQRKIQFPWLATAIADFHALESERDAKHLERKKHPAIKSAEAVREHGRAKREAELKFRMLRYRVEYYEKLFPWILDYVGDDVPDETVEVTGLLSEFTDDPAVQWLTKAEYEKLPTAQKYQRALDNWRSSKKTSWQVGREYERYVGYVYETQGYDVEFTGAVEGFEDMGRDLVVRRGNELLVIQCKYWAMGKEIREKHIFQLFGSAFEYAFKRGLLDSVSRQITSERSPNHVSIIPMIYTSTVLSEVAKSAADKLQVRYFENVRISEYPMIKCNVSMRDGERIYHLPFDQQYDRTKIGHAPGERYVYTVAEAEQAGFRRAWKWRSPQAV
jgi:hypothetical protein